MPPTGYFSGAWAHYNWSCDGSSTNGCASSLSRARDGMPALPYDVRFRCLCRCTADRQYCNSRSHIEAVSSPPWPTPRIQARDAEVQRLPYGQQGNLRNPGAITANYDYVLAARRMPRRLTPIPMWPGSNVCMTCHVGRETGDTIKGLNDPALLSAGTISSFNFGNPVVHQLPLSDGRRPGFHRYGV